jgi:hypothetical protein
VRQLQSRAFAFMQERMTALGYVPPESKRQRTWMRIRMRPLPVLRERRFALWSPTGHNAFAR